MTTDGNGTVLVTGFSGGPLGGQPFSGVLDMFVAARRPSSNVDESWARQWGTAGADKGRAIATDAAGNIFIAGDIDGTIDGQTSSGGNDLSLTKWNADRTRAWTLLWGTNDFETTYALAVHPGGDVYVAGHTFGDLQQENAGAEDIFLSKISADGKVSWSKQWGGTGTDAALALAVDSAGAVYLAGTLGDNAYCAKLSALGVQEWSTTWGGPKYEVATGIALLPNGEIVISGHSGGQVTGATGSGGAFVSKLSAAGTVLWTNQFGTATSDYARAVAVAPNGDFLVAGEVAGPLYLNAHQGQDDAFLQKRRQDGSVIWTKQFGTAASEYCYGLTVTSDGTAHIAGSTNGAFAGFKNNGGFDNFMIVVAP